MMLKSRPSLIHILLFALLLIMTGCTAIGPAFVAAPMPKSDEARIYIYRVPNYIYDGCDSKFFINNVNIANLNINSYCSFILQPVVYVFKQKWSWLATGPLHNDPIEFSMEVKGGRTYYMRFKALL